MVAGILPRLRARQALTQETETSSAPAVTVEKPARGAPSEEVVTAGNNQAFVDAPIYARTSGYLKHWYFDIGAHVKQGQLLADIESPEVDQQLAQSREDLNTTQADLHLAQITATRYIDLFKTDSVAKQDVDNAVQNAAARAAAVKAAQATSAACNRWSALKRFTLRSPVSSRQETRISASSFNPVPDRIESCSRGVYRPVARVCQRAADLLSADPARLGS